MKDFEQFIKAASEKRRNRKESEREKKNEQPSDTVEGGSEGQAGTTDFVLLNSHGNEVATSQQQGLLPDIFQDVEIGIKPLDIALPSVLDEDDERHKEKGDQLGNGLATSPIIDAATTPGLTIESAQFNPDRNEDK